MYNSASVKRTTLKISIMIFVAVVAGAFMLAPDRVESASKGDSLITPEPTPTRKLPVKRATAAQRKYSQFPHDQKAHRIACSSCHKFPSENWKKVRKADEAFPDITDYPKHASCINCHKQQFFTGRPPVICSICHTNPGPRNSNRHPFPNPREIFDQSPKGNTAESDFAVRFPHDVHVDIVSGAIKKDPVFVNASWATSRRMAEESCAVCHKTMSSQGDASEEFLVKPPAELGDAFWLKKGTFKTVPTGHTTCFTCHNADSGITPAPTDCATCHKLKQPLGPADFDPSLAAKMGATERVMLDAWRTRTSSGTFRHEWASHAELSCSTCHNVSTLVTDDQKTKKVQVTSCNMCHITATSDDGGVLNYEVDKRKKDPAFQCVKCHISFGKQPIPDSHLKAIEAAGK